MARRQVDDIQDTSVQGAARQVNTFVAAPRAVRTNTALELSAALSGVTQVLQQKQELDVKAATDQKLYGSSVYADFSPEMLAGYETQRDNLRSMEDFEKWFMESTQQEFNDPHAAAGYEEKRLKDLARYRGSHAKFLASVQVKERSENVFKDYVATVKQEGVEAAEARKLDVAKNYNIKPNELNQMSINAVGVLIAQGELDKAEAVLTHKRGAAGTLLDNPETAKEAAALGSKLQTARKDLEDAQVEAFKRQQEVNKLQQAQNEVNFKEIMDDPSIPYEEKVKQLNKMDVLGEVSDGFGTEVRRYLKSVQELNKDTNSDVMAGIITRVYDINELAESEPEEYLRGVSQINRDIMDMRANKQLSDQDVKTLEKQIKTLTSPKLADATTGVAANFRDAQKQIEKQLPAAYRGEAIRELFYATDPEVLQAEEQDLSTRNIRQMYNNKVQDVINNINTKRREKAQQALLNRTIPDEDKQLIERLGFSVDDVRKQAEALKKSPADVIKILKDELKNTEVQKQTSPTSQESEQIKIDEGKVLDEQGNHVSYLDPLGYPTGGYGHLLTEEEKRMYPPGTLIPEEVVLAWKEQDMKEAQEDVSVLFGDDLKPEVRNVLTNMAFNLGRSRLEEFDDLRAAIASEDYAEAAKAMRDSLWYRQTGNRAERLVERIASLQ